MLSTRRAGLSWSRSQASAFCCFQHVSVFVVTPCIQVGQTACGPVDSTRPSQTQEDANSCHPGILHVVHLLVCVLWSRCALFALPHYLGSHLLDTSVFWADTCRCGTPRKRWGFVSSMHGVPLLYCCCIWAVASPPQRREEDAFYTWRYIV